MRIQDLPCPIERANEVLGKKWTLLILRDIYSGKHNFTKFLEENPKLSTRMLSLRLKELDVEGFIEKRIVSKTPLKALYFLTEKGKATRHILKQFAIFSMYYHPDFEMKENDRDKIIGQLEMYFA